MKKLIAATICAALASPVIHAASPANEAIALNISEPSLGQALTQLAIQADLKLVYYSDLKDTRTPPSVIGRYTPAAALRLLLQNTLLHAVFVDAHTVLIRKNADGSQETGSPTNGNQQTASDKPGKAPEKSE